MYKTIECVKVEDDSDSDTAKHTLHEDFNMDGAIASGGKLHTI